MKRYVVIALLPAALVAAFATFVPRAQDEQPAVPRSTVRAPLFEGLVFSDHAADGSGRVLRIERVERVPGRVGIFRMPLLDQLALRHVELAIDGQVVEQVEELRLGGLASVPPPGALRLAREARGLLERMPIPAAAPLR